MPKVTQDFNWGQVRNPDIFCRSLPAVLNDAAEQFAVTPTETLAGALTRPMRVFAPEGSSWIVGGSVSVAVPAGQAVRVSLWSSPTLTGVFTQDTGSLVQIEDVDGTDFKDEAGRQNPFVSPAGGSYLQLGFFYTDDPANPFPGEVYGELLKVG